MIQTDRFDFDREVVQTSREMPVLVVFEAGWCDACRKLDARLSKLEHELADRMSVVHLDVDAHAELARRLNVRALPCVVAFRGGQPIGGFTGAPSEGVMRRFMLRVLPPAPGTDERLEGRAHLREGRLPQAVEQLRVAVMLDPSKDDTRADYVRALARAGRVGEARRAFEPLALDAARAARWSALGVWLDAVTIASTAADAPPAGGTDSVDDEGDSARRFRSAQAHIAAGRWDEALEALMPIVEHDRAFGDDAARRAMLAVFELADDPALASAWRRRLGAALF